MSEVAKRNISSACVKRKCVSPEEIADCRFANKWKTFPFYTCRWNGNWGCWIKYVNMFIRQRASRIRFSGPRQSTQPTRSPQSAKRNQPWKGRSNHNSQAPREPNITTIAANSTSTMHTAKRNQTQPAHKQPQTSTHKPFSKLWKICITKARTSCGL